MEDFKELFKDEAKDLLCTLEETLMQLEDDLRNKELINEVFRIMHSLKGSGAMFGYTNLSNFTHNLETLYHKIRNDQILLDPDIITFTISAGDHISQLLKNDSSDQLVESTDKLKNHIQSLLDVLSTEASTSTTEESNNDDVTNNEKSNHVFYIKFEPNEDIFSDGTNPLYLIDELADLGEVIIKIYHDNLPAFDDIVSEKCYLSWTIILSTQVSVNEIVDVFIFVEDESTITVELLSDKDLFSLINARSTFEFVIKNNPDEIESYAKAVSILEEQITESVIEQKITKTKQSVIIQEQNDNQKVSENQNLTLPQNHEIKIHESINIETVKVSSSKLDTLINLVSELVTTQARLVNIASQNSSTELTLLSEDFQQLSRQFRDIAFDMRLIPIQTMVIKFKRLVRDLSKNLGKKVTFTTEGTETELDKNIIATLSDPIMHIIRNAIDHGIEIPDVRIKNGKNETGTIQLKAKYSGTSILIQIKDDGQGINTDNVLHKALEKKLISPSDELSEKEIYELLLLPGFSTNEVVTSVSGRGVGMDVVRKKINDLRGEVTIDSEKGKGTEITIRLPLTLSIIDGLLVTINTDKFVIPLSSVKQIYQVSEKAINESSNHIINIEGVQFPFINLPTAFSGNQVKSNEHHFITVRYHDNTVGLVVNKLISEYQAVLKPIGSILENNEIFAGATILGDGKVALVLDTNKLIEFYSNQKTE